MSQAITITRRRLLVTQCCDTSQRKAVLQIFCSVVGAIQSDRSSGSIFIRQRFSGFSGRGNMNASSSPETALRVNFRKAPAPFSKRNVGRLRRSRHGRFQRNLPACGRSPRRDKQEGAARKCHTSPASPGQELKPDRDVLDQTHLGLFARVCARL